MSRLTLGNHMATVSGLPERKQMMRGPRVLLADDHTLLLEAFERLLSPECEVVARVSDGRAAGRADQELHPDVVVLDVAMPLSQWPRCCPPN